ncbi:hypothetical protein KDM41_10900 [bacterium]|nr:hypothetical protein [bacterium]
MKRKQGIGLARATGVLLTGILVMFAGGASAHCDSMTGPVVPDARAALESGDLDPVLKWIMPEYEAEVSDAFQRAVEVRALGDDARELADRYFLETLIRVHREGEGAPYTGLKDDPAAPIVQMADQALADGSVEGMMEKINRHLASVVGEKFQAALEAGKNKDRSAEAGREFVAAYVTYVHYVEGVHDAIVASGGHHAEHNSDSGHAH